MRKASGQRRGGQLLPEVYVGPLENNRRFCEQLHSMLWTKRHLHSGAASPTCDAGVETVSMPDALLMPIVSAIGTLGCSCRPV